IGDTFSKFTSVIDDQAAEVRAVVSELDAVGSGLRSIDTALQSPGERLNFDTIESDLDLVRDSLTHTLDDTCRILVKVGNGDGPLTATACRQAWKDITSRFQHSGG